MNFDSNRVTKLMSRYRYYPPNEWRQAFLDYLMGQWAGTCLEGSSLMFWSPSMDCELNLNKKDGAYEAGGGFSVHGYDLSSHPVPTGGLFLTVENDRDAVDVGLIRFVKDNQIRTLKINLPGSTCFLLWKGQTRGELYFWTNMNVCDSSPEGMDIFVSSLKRQ